MPNFEQPPINVPENSDVEKKEDEIKNEEKVETELNQEPKNTEAEDKNDDIFEKTESVNDQKEGEKKEKSWLRRHFNNVVTGAVIAGGLGNVADAVSKSAEVEFTSGEKNKTEQLVSVETQRQKIKIVEPFKDLDKEDLEKLVDKSGNISLYDLVDLIYRRLPGTYAIDSKDRESANKIVEEATKRLTIGTTHIYVIAQDDPLSERFAQKSRERNNTGKVEDYTVKSNKAPDVVAFIDLENNTVKLVFATR
jgi:hypothetical protein